MKPCPDKPTLYLDPFVPVCRAVGVTARFLKLDCDVKVMSIMKGDNKSKDFVKVNPLGTLPTMVDGDLTLTESQAIAAYLVNKCGKDTKLYGSNAEEMAKIDELLCDAKTITDIFRKTLYALYFGGEGPTDAEREKVVKVVAEVDERLENNLYNLGNYPTLADIFLYNTLISFAILTNFHVPYKHMMEWADRLTKAVDFKGPEDKLRAIAQEMKKKAPTLYYNPLSPPSRACHMIACHLNVPVNLKVLDLAAGEHKKAEYLAINPAGTVPCLAVKADKQCKVEADVNIGDSNPIATYLANTYGKNSTLYGKDAAQKARVDEFLIAEGRFRDNVGATFIHKAFGGPELTDEQKQKLEESLSQVESRLTECTYTCGDNLTVVDFLVYQTLVQLELVSGKCERPSIQKFISQMASLPYHKFAHKGLEEVKVAMKLGQQ